MIFQIQPGANILEELGLARKVSKSVLQHGGSETVHSPHLLPESTKYSGTPPDKELEGDHKYILIGLHTCGDLAPTMLKVYSQSTQIVGLVSVGCCYMKLSTSQPITANSIGKIPVPDHEALLSPHPPSLAQVVGEH